jgi:hypothetical protein
MSRNRTSTTNGAAAFKSTGNNLVNFFFNVGASRNNISGAKDSFEMAFAQDKTKAAAILLWARDIRHGGAGERAVFRAVLADLIKADVSLAEKVLRQIPACGRFDDLTVAYGTPLESLAVGIWKEALEAGNAIAFKWADRSDKRLQKAFRMNEARLRKFISNGRKATVVEQAMCAKDWGNISYGKLPSVAGLRYSKAFKKHDEKRYSDFMTNKNTKVNAAVAFPHDVYRLYKNANGDDVAASKYWENLADIVADGNILPMCDVSGSMECPASGDITCLDVSISLGVYLAQRIKGKFNGKLITFSEFPTIVDLPKSKKLGDLFSFVGKMNWGMNTNFDKAFMTILAEARKYNVAPADMPKMLLVLSDMQFDQGVRGNTAHETMKQEFARYGYTMPKVVYWNLNASYGNFPTMGSESNVALVSGFSPKVLEAVLQSKEFGPESVMNEAIAPFIKMLA